MYITPAYNATLLQVIAEAGELTYEELKQKYLPSEQPGIVLGITVTFDSDLKTLENIGYVIREGDVIRYNGR